jgi:hypothetical protein
MANQSELIPINLLPPICIVKSVAYAKVLSSDLTYQAIKVMAFAPVELNDVRTAPAKNERSRLVYDESTRQNLSVSADEAAIQIFIISASDQQSNTQRRTQRNPDRYERVV